MPGQISRSARPPEVPTSRYLDLGLVSNLRPVGEPRTCLARCEHPDWLIVLDETGNPSGAIARRCPHDDGTRGGCLIDQKAHRASDVSWTCAHWRYQWNTAGEFEGPNNLVAKNTRPLTIRVHSIAIVEDAIVVWIEENER